MRPPTVFFAAVARPCLATTSHLRPHIPSRLPAPLHPPQTRAASWSDGLSERLRSWMSMRENANRQRDAAEQRRARERAAEQGEGSIFDTEAVRDVQELEVVEEAKAITQGRPAKVRKPAKVKKAITEARYRTATFKISHRKLNKLANQIGGKPIDSAILQMQFSAKRAASRIKSLLALGRNQAADRGMRTERMVVAEAWVNKGPKLMRMDIRGRGRFGIKHHPSARMHIVLKEGKTRAEKKEEALRKRIGLVRSAGWYREDVPIRNARPYYVW